MAKSLDRAKGVNKRLFESSSSESDIFGDDSDADPDFILPTSSEEEGYNVVARRAQGPAASPVSSKATSRSPHPTTEKAIPSRWRKKAQSSKELNKERRNEGRPYKDSTGKLISGRCIGELCHCPLKCQKIFSVATQKEIFEGFWNLSNFDKQNAYLFGCIEAFNVKRLYGNTTPETSRRQKSYYFNVDIDGEIKRICRKSFLAIHGLQNSRGRLNNVLKQIKSGSTPKTDARGKHENRPHRISEDRVQSVHDHIKSIPTYQSHYSRSQNPQKMFFDSNLTIQSLYEDLYLTYCKEQNINPVSADFYRRTFCECYNIGFKLPRSDTCRICDHLNILLTDNASSEQEKNDASTKRELHLRKAEALRNTLKELSAKSKENPDDIHTISIDLQQTLPTPKLSCGPAFYLRKLWTYNVGIHDCGNDIGYMFLWDETIAARGSDEIGSCMLKYIRNMNIKSKKLVIFSDNCSGQNKNYKLVALYNYMILTGMFEEIEHYYLITGHTYLPSDKDFAKIEKYQKKESNVYSPEEWRMLITKCGKNKKFIVKQMTKEYIYNLAELKSSLNTNKQKCDEGHPLKFKDAICLKFSISEPMTMMVKHLVNQDFIKVSLKKRGKTPNLGSSALKQKYNEAHLINPKKIADIKQLLPYIPQVHHYYYNNLRATEEQTDDGPEIIE